MIVGIILAAGKGTRIKAKDRNKVTLPFLNKPLVVYSVELMRKVADKVIVVIGAFHQSVKEVLKDFPVDYAYQKKRLGTAHAVKVVIPLAQKYQPQLVLVGYGDHTMFYQKENIDDLINLHQKENAVMTIITVKHNNENLHWGYIIRNLKNEIIDSVEFKDATDEQKKIKELNAGFYCFDFAFLKENIGKVPKSSVSGEYYINSLIKIAADQGKKVAGLEIPFSSVGIGVNRWSELEESQRLYLNIKKSKV
ncbi:MAG: sugar phosphate nucleotidyltransferase [Microgenomates group bacterium]